MAIAPGRLRPSPPRSPALKTPDDPKVYRSDYGSQLRDTAGVLALAAEFTPAGIDIPALSSKLADLRDLAKYTSTQEDAWTLVAAAALARQTASGSVTIDGKALAGSVYQRYQQEHFETAPVTIVNNRQPADRNEGLGQRYPGDATAGDQPGLHHQTRVFPPGRHAPSTRH